MPQPKIKRPTIFQIWIRAVRAPALPATLLPVLLGGGFALVDRGFDGWSFLLAMIAALLVQAGAHLINDYYDHQHGDDAPGSLSPANPVQRGWLTLRQIYIGGWVCFVLAALAGCYLVYQGGWVVLLLGVVGIAAAYLYSGTRYALSYRRLGEAAAFLLLGPLLVLATYYVMVKIIFLHVIVNAVPIGILAASVVYANNLRDIEHDENIGKKTLASWLGRKWAKHLYAALLLAAYGVIALLWALNLTPATALLTLLVLPLALRNMWIVYRTHDPMELNLVWGLTVLHQLLFGILNVFAIFLYYFLQ